MSHHGEVLLQDLEPWSNVALLMDLRSLRYKAFFAEDSTVHLVIVNLSSLLLSAPCFSGIF